nr:TlpA disulfide reductase family protein [Mycolicibacterium chlorophenolicum]
MGEVVAGPPTLINLWASWCAPCREEMPVLDAYAAAPQAVRVIGVNVSDRPDAAESLVRDLRIRYPSLTDADDVQRALGAPPLLPLSYLIAANGTIRRLQDVLVFGDLEQVRTSVTAALQETGAR